MSYVITIVTNDGEAIVSIIGNAHPPQFDNFYTWSEYQRVLHSWLQQYTTELGQVHDSEENLTFVVYKVEK